MKRKTDRKRAVMKDILLPGGRKKKRERNFRCARCRRILLFTRKMSGMCMRCADTVMAETGRILRERDAREENRTAKKDDSEAE